MKQTIHNIFKWIEGISSFYKVISLFLLLAGGISWHDANVIRKYNAKNEEAAKAKRLETVIKNQEEQKKTDSLILLNIDKVASKVEDHTRTLNALDKSYQGLLRGLRLYDTLFLYIQEKTKETPPDKASNIPKVSFKYNKVIK